MSKITQFKKKLKKVIKYPHPNTDMKAKELTRHCQNYIEKEGKIERLKGVAVGVIVTMLIMYIINR